MSTSDRSRRKSRATGGVLLALAISSCAELFGIEDSERPRETDAGAGEASGDSGGAMGGRDGQAGEAGGGIGGDAGSGGSGGNVGGASGSKSGGAGRGGLANGGNGAGSGRSGTGGMSGSDGMGGAKEFPERGDPCPALGLVACPGEASDYQLRCDGTIWVNGQACDNFQRCDRRTGACEAMVVRCDPQMPFPRETCLDNHSAERCGPDLVTLELEFCDFMCETDRCIEPKPHQVYVDRPRAIQGDSLWPEPIIPVCLADPESWTVEMLEVVRDAFNERWGRHSALALTGFEPCTGTSAGVSLALAQECDAELARIPRVGYPGPSALLPVTLCQSYIDAAGDRHDVWPPSGPPLFRHAVEHVFGHVVGYNDEPYVPNVPSVMSQAIDVDPYVAPSWESWNIDSVQGLYGLKPIGSLVDSSGRCLSWTNENASFTREACDGAPERTFALESGYFEHMGSGRFLSRVAGNTVGLVARETAELWQANRVALLWTGGCVSVRPSGDTSNPLIRETCSPERAAAQTWSFEFPGRGRARIRLERDNSYVLWPEPRNQPPTLGFYDGVNDLFDTTFGELSMGGRCLLDRRVCDGISTQRFALSGPIQTHDGSALTVVGQGNAAELSVTPLVGLPAPEQVVDYYFH